MAEYDPDKANDYLDEMGLTERDAEGYRLMPNGQRLTIFWDYAPIFGAWKPIGELLRAHYEKIGVDLQLREVARQLFYERFRARETDLGLWTGHGTFFPIVSPRDFAAIHYGGSKWSAQYGRWYETGGVDGIEPPPDSDIRKSQLLYDKCLSAATVDESIQAFDELLDNFYNNLWTMGFTTPPVQPVIVKNDFRNVPDGVLSTWYLLSPGSTAPEQYFFKQG
jgi:peptide/nickel transport system substrate-binding protein